MFIFSYFVDNFFIFNKIILIFYFIVNKILWFYILKVLFLFKLLNNMILLNKIKEMNITFLNYKKWMSFGKNIKNIRIYLKN